MAGDSRQRVSADCPREVGPQLVRGLFKPSVDLLSVDAVGVEAETSLYPSYAGVSAAGDAKWSYPDGINGLLTITIY